MYSCRRRAAAEAPALDAHDNDPSSEPSVLIASPPSTSMTSARRSDAAGAFIAHGSTTRRPAHSRSQSRSHARP